MIQPSAIFSSRASQYRVRFREIKKPPGTGGLSWIKIKLFHCIVVSGVFIDPENNGDQDRRDEEYADQQQICLLPGQPQLFKFFHRWWFGKARCLFSSLVRNLFG